MERLDWMLGMTQNMMNMAEEKMPEMYPMTSAMMGNLNHMKVRGVDMDAISMMEPMMRNMEKIMSSMDENNQHMRDMMMHMMHYVVHMQMSMIMME